MSKVPSYDALLPAQVVERLENIGVAKTQIPLFSLVLLGMMAGAFIGFGGMFYTLIRGLLVALETLPRFSWESEPTEDDADGRVYPFPTSN